MAIIAILLFYLEGMGATLSPPVTDVSAAQGEYYVASIDGHCMIVRIPNSCSTKHQL